MSDSPYRPLEGDPDELIAKARHYQEIGSAIARSANTLKAIGEQHDMTSKAVDALRDTSRSVGEDIDKARERYQKTAEALLTYGAELRKAQDKANTAISLITTRQGEADAAHTAATKANGAVSSATSADKSDAQTAATKAQTAATEADGALQKAQQQWQDALTDKNNAAAAAITAIVDVVDKHNNGLKDSWWDDWGSALFSIIKTICDWAGVLAIFLSWVPILGQVLLVLAAVGAVLDLVDAIIKFKNGEGSWGDILLAAVGAVLTLGGGKLIALAAKGAKGAVVLKGAEALRAEGKNVRVEMKALQNAKWGTEAYMTQAEARAAVRGGRQAFDTFAHGRSTILTAFKDSFTADVKAFKADGVRTLLGNKVYDLKNGLVFGTDLNQSMRIIKAYPQLLHDPAVIKAMAGATALQVGKVGTDVLHGLSAASHAEHERVADGNLHSPSTTWLDRGFSVVKSIGVEPAGLYGVKGAVDGSVKIPSEAGQVLHPAR
ncbi:MAG TPA: hypothetical protein VN107_08455 [Microbacterium sp.]|nr:hypothetical protein [Microbacterium sp.]